MRELLTTPATPASAADAKGFDLSRLYGRLVSHIEREEEAKAGAAWLVTRTLRLLSYVTDLALCMRGVCGIGPGLPGGAPLALARSVRATLLRVQVLSGGPARSVGRGGGGGDEGGGG